MTRLKPLLLSLFAAALLFGGGLRFVEAQQSGGAFVPSFNYLITGLWNFQNGLQTNGATLQTNVVTLNNTQTLALNYTPITIIPLCTQGVTTSCVPSGYVAVPVYGTASFAETSTYGAGSDLRLYYTSRTAGNAASGAITFAGFLDTAASVVSPFTGVIAGPEPAGAAKAVVIQQTLGTTMTGGNAANTLKITVDYYLHAI